MANSFRNWFQQRSKKQNARPHSAIRRRARLIEALEDRRVLASFELAGTLSTPIDGYSMTVGDLNRDNSPDLVILGYNQVEVRLANGDGSFGPSMISLWKMVRTRSW